MVIGDILLLRPALLCMTERMISTTRLGLDPNLIDQKYHSLHNTTLACSLALRLVPL